MDAIEFKNVNIYFNNNITCIIGSNGSGKSYLMKTIYSNLRNKNVYYMPQYLEDELYKLTVLDEIKSIIPIKDEDKQMTYIKNALKIIGLNDNILDKDPTSLNELNLRKINIVKMFLSNRDYLLLDEPTLLLNDIDKTNFIKIIKKMKRTYNKNIIISTNDMELVNQIGNDIILLSDDKIIQETKSELFKNIDLLNQCNLNIPNLLEFSDVAHNKKGIQYRARDDINDLIKDILRNINKYSKGE